LHVSQTGKREERRGGLRKGRDSDPGHRPPRRTSRGRGGGESILIWFYEMLELEWDTSQIT
jgi:hypothetical protein